jgi:hypothetical protein
MMPFLKTPAAADLLGVGSWRLIGLLRSKRLAPPQKDSSGDYLWTNEDLERARQALASRRLNNGQSQDNPALRNLAEVPAAVADGGHAS